MIALIRKELRELALPAVALVLCAFIITAMDLLYNRYYPQYKGQGVALSVWLIISVAVAFLGGGAAIARETRQRLTFLTSWPQGRAKLWLVKSLVSFVLTMATIAAGFGICLIGVSLGHYTWPSDLGSAARDLSQILPLCFVLGLLWSGLISSVLGAAALGFVTGCTLMAAVGYFFVFYLPANWGPYVGTIIWNDGLDYWTGLLAVVITLFAGAWAFIRVPILDTRRRVRVAMSLLLGMVLSASLLFFAYNLVVGRPSLQRQVAESGLSEDGKTLFFRTNSGPIEHPDSLSAYQSSGLWVADLQESKPRLVCRVTGGFISELDNWVWLLGTTNRNDIFWSYNTNSRRLHRMLGEPGSGTLDGRYWTTMRSEPGGGEATIWDDRGQVMILDPPIRFAADNRTLLFKKDDYVTALDLTTRQQRKLVPLKTGFVWSAVSPDGRVLFAYQQLASQKGVLPEAIFVDLQTGVQTRLRALAPPSDPFVSSRYAWLPERDPVSRELQDMAIFDAKRMQITKRLPRKLAHGFTWHQPGVPYVIFPTQPPRHGPPGPPPAPGSPPEPQRLYLANPDGSGLRFLREDNRQILGMAPDGHLIIWDRQRTFLSWNPLTNEEKPILTLPDIR